MTGRRGDKSKKGSKKGSRRGRSKSGSKRGRSKSGSRKKTRRGKNYYNRTLNEVDKTFYELAIQDLNRRLARLRAYTEETLQKNEELMSENQKMDEDRNDIIIYLKRMLQEKVDEISQLEERINGLQETRENEIKTYEEKIEEMEAEYKTMHDQLTSENKLLDGKLNALEEFRTQRDELMKKYEKQEQEIERQEKRHKREMYELERKFIISKDQLKRDMEERLLKLSTDFHDATELRIAATTHRVIRENIAVNNELDLLLQNQQRLYNENTSLKKRDATLRQQAELHEGEKKKALGKVKVQLKIIDQLTNSHKYLKKQIQKLKDNEAELLQIKNENRSLNNRIKTLEYDKRILEQNLHNVRCSRTSLETDYEYLKEEYDRLSEILLEAVSAVKEFLTVRSEVDRSMQSRKREVFVNSLFTLLNKAREERIRRPSLETVDSMDATYAKGDLGFVPKPVELRPSVKVYRNMDTQTGTSFEEYLAFGKISGYKPEYNESSSGRSGLETEVESEQIEEEEVESVLFFNEEEAPENDDERSSQEFDIFGIDEEGGDEGDVGEVSSVMKGEKLEDPVAPDEKKEGE